jgi:predicted lysophospholipase L1 biosynthesis ABC-type transport system permease subunit
VHGAESAGFAAAPLDGLATGADLCVALGAGPAPASALALTDGMPHRVLLDSLAERRYAGEPDRAVRRELFFGERLTEQTAARQEAARQGAFRLRWIVTVSLVVTVIGVSNALLMSVTERFREIGTMKCLGALSSFIRLLFLIESSLIGLAGSILGALAGTVMATAAYAFSYGFGPVLTSMAYGWLLLAVLGSIVVGTLLSIVAAIYPATIASRMVPAAALRSTV